MPRQPRNDLEPRVFLRDTSEQTGLARDAIDGDNFQVLVFDRAQSIGRERRVYIFHALNRVLTQYRNQGIKLDEGLLSFMMHNCELVDIRVETDAQRNPIREGGSVLYRLVRVGCRLYMTQQEVADQYMVSRDKVIKQIALYRECYLILNSGQGWYEFDASLCWSGNLGICAAYQVVQQELYGTTYVDSEIDADAGR
jgi:hypothetical protein